MNIRVAIFEDNKLVREALCEILNGTEGFICTGAFANGAHWLQDVRRSEPDVLLMDIEMPGLDGIELTALITSTFPAVRVLIQTVFADADKIFRALCAGASGYILKNDSPQQYITAISEVWHGGSPMSASVAKKVLGFFANKNVILISPEVEDYQLSTREREILRMMVEGDNYKAIAGKAFISYETVRTHVKHIYRKLHVACRSEAVMKSIQQRLH